MTDWRALDELVSQATAGPWEASTVYHGRWWMATGPAHHMDSADLRGPTPSMRAVVDARAIVALRNAWPGIRELIERQEAELERLRRVEGAAQAYVRTSPKLDGGHDYEAVLYERYEALRAALRGEP